MNTFKRLGFLVLTFGFAAAPSAHAFDVSAMGGATISNYSFDPSASVDWGTSFIVGGLIGQDFAPGLGLELGALYAARKLGGTVTVTSSSLDIPVLFRFTGVPILLVEAGGYIAPGLSSSAAFGSLSATGGAPKTDVGLRGVVGVRIPLVPKLSLRAQAQYSLGLTNIADNSVVSAKTRAIDVLGGITIDL